MLAQALLGNGSAGIGFEVAVHVATLVAVVAFYRARIAQLASDALQPGTGLEQRAAAWRYVGKLGLATVPAVLAGLAAADWLAAQFERPGLAAGCLLVTGALVWSTRRTLSRAQAREPSWSAAWWIGCAQALAILPGISRSGATVATALALGVAPLPAAAFSFLMSIPAILGAALLQLPELGDSSFEGGTAIALGAVAALAAGLFALALFVRLLRGRSFHRFAYYVWAVGLAGLIWSAASS